jgi:hypothetical protein
MWTVSTFCTSRRVVSTLLRRHGCVLAELVLSLSISYASSLSLLQFSVSPSFVIELLNRVVKVFKDYCGVLTEEAIRKNFILIYELLDEVLVRDVV